MKVESLLNAAIDEIKYAIRTEKTKSIEVRTHYINNAIRYIEEAKDLSNTTIKELRTQRDLARQAPLYQCPHCNKRIRKD